MSLPVCVNHKVCGGQGFIYIYGKYYCGECFLKAQEKIKAAQEAFLIRE